MKFSIHSMRASSLKKQPCFQSWKFWVPCFLPRLPAAFSFSFFGFSAGVCPEADFLSSALTRFFVFADAVPKSWLTSFVSMIFCSIRYLFASSMIPCWVAIVLSFSAIVFSWMAMIWFCSPIIFSCDFVFVPSSFILASFSLDSSFMDAIALFFDSMSLFSFWLDFYISASFFSSSRMRMTLASNTSFSCLFI